MNFSLRLLRRSLFFTHTETLVVHKVRKMRLSSVVGLRDAEVLINDSKLYLISLVKFRSKDRKIVIKYYDCRKEESLRRIMVMFFEAFSFPYVRTKKSIHF